MKVEIEKLPSNIEDKFINTEGTEGKVLRKTRKHKESEVKNKKWFSNACNEKYKELKIISKSLNRSK